MNSNRGTILPWRGDSPLFWADSPYDGMIRPFGGANRPISGGELVHKKGSVSFFSKQIQQKVPTPNENELEVYARTLYMLKQSIFQIYDNLMHQNIPTTKHNLKTEQKEDKMLLVCRSRLIP